MLRITVEMESKSQLDWWVNAYLSRGWELEEHEYFEEQKNGQTIYSQGIQKFYRFPEKQIVIAEGYDF